MAERDHSDESLEFEFFDEPPEEREPSSRREKEPRRPPGGPGGLPPMRPRAPRGGTPIVRLAALVGVVIVVGVLITIGVTSCRGDGSSSDYREYLQSVASLSRASEDVGRQFIQLLSQPGLTLDDLQSQLDGLAEQQTQVVSGALKLTPPASLAAAQLGLVEAMRFREEGLRGMAEAVSTIQPSSDAGDAGSLLADQGDRLIAGDVVYADRFADPAAAALKDSGETGIEVPTSVFLSDQALVEEDSLTAMIERINQGGGESIGKHGNGIARVVVQPDGQELSADIENEIVVTNDFAIEVVIENSGDFQETDVTVTITIQGNPPIKKTVKIDVINPGETGTARFEDFVDLPYTALTTLKIAVKPVAGEENTSNNSVDYPVIFTLA